MGDVIDIHHKRPTELSALESTLRRCHCLTGTPLLLFYRVLRNKIYAEFIWTRSYPVHNTLWTSYGIQVHLTPANSAYPEACCCFCFRAYP